MGQQPGAGHVATPCRQHLGTAGARRPSAVRAGASTTCCGVDGGRGSSGTSGRNGWRRPLGTSGARRPGATQATRGTSRHSAALAASSPRRAPGHGGTSGGQQPGAGQVATPCRQHLGTAGARRPGAVRAARGTSEIARPSQRRAHRARRATAERPGLSGQAPAAQGGQGSTSWRRHHRDRQHSPVRVATSP